MDNRQNKSPLAKRFEGFELQGAYPGFEDFQSKRYKKRRRIIWFLSVIALVIMVIGWTRWDGGTAQNQIVYNQVDQPQNVPSVVNKHNETENPTESRVVNTTTPFSLNSKAFKKVIQFKSFAPKNVDSANNYSILHLLNLKPKPLKSLVVWLEPDLESTKMICYASSSDSSSKKVKKSPFVIFGAGLNIASSDLKMSQNANKYIHPDFKKIYNQTQLSKASMLIKTTLNLPINNRFWIGTGLGFTSNQLGGEYRFQIDSVPVYDIDNTIAGFIVYPDGSPSKQVELGSALRSYSFATIPVSVLYVFNRPKWSIHSEIGTEFSYLISSRGNALDAYNIKQIVPINGILNPEYFSVYGKLSFYKNINAKMAVGLSISTNLQMNNLYKVQYFKATNQMTQFQLSTKFNLMR